MRRWRTHRVFLRIGPLRSGFQSGHGAGQEEALAAWALWCEQHPGGACELALSGHALIACAAPPAQAVAQWEHYLGIRTSELAQLWVMRSAQGVDLSCAAPVALIEALQKVAHEHAVKLRWVGPWWARDAQRWLAQAPDDQDEHSLRAWEPGLVTRLVRAEDARNKRALSSIWTERTEVVSGVAGQAPPTERGATDIVAEVAEGVVLAEWPGQGASAFQLDWAKGNWADALDFVGPRVRPALASWAVMVAGVAACIGVSEEARQVNADRQEALVQLHRLDRAQHQLTMAQAKPRTKPSSGSALVASSLDNASLRQATRVAQLLAYPWSQVIELAERSALQERAVLTSFSLDIGNLGGQSGARPPLRLQAAVRDDASALRWAALHGDGAQVLGRDVLSAPFDTLAGRYTLRVEAVWQPTDRP